MGTIPADGWVLPQNLSIFAMDKVRGRACQGHRRPNGASDRFSALLLKGRGGSPCHGSAAGESSWASTLMPDSKCPCTPQNQISGTLPPKFRLPPLLTAFSMYDNRVSGWGRHGRAGRAPGEGHACNMQCPNVAFRIKAGGCMHALRGRKLRAQINLSSRAECSGRLPPCMCTVR